LGEAFLALLERDQKRLLRLCNALETIADALPGGRPERTAKILAFLDKAYARHVFLHEKYLFPLVRSLEEKKEPAEQCLRQLEFEHAADHGLIAEITSAFMSCSGGDSKMETHMLGYLLRSFFENCRRHCAWERNVLYPVVKKHLAGGTPREQHDELFRLSVGLGTFDGILRAAVR